MQEQDSWQGYWALLTAFLFNWTILSFSRRLQFLLTVRSESRISYRPRKPSKRLVRLDSLEDLSSTLTSSPINSFFNPFQDGYFRDCSRMGGPFWSPLPKIRHTYPTMMKLGTVIPYLRKIQKMYKSRDTFLKFCWHQHFLTGNQQILLHQEIHI